MFSNEIRARNLFNYLTDKGFGEENQSSISEIVGAKTSESTAPSNFVSTPSSNSNSAIQSDGSAVSAIAQGADSYVDNVLTKLSTVSQVESVNSALKEAGLDSALKNMTKERMKAILAAIGMFACIKTAKGHYKKLFVILVGIYAISYATAKISNSSQDNQSQAS